jgi:hypothetical protein
VVLTNKTSSFITMKTKQYLSEVHKHLHTRLAPSRLKGKNLQRSLRRELLISKDEMAFIKEKLISKAVPSPKILVKDHKKPNADGNYPTCLVCPAWTLTSGFPKLGYKAFEKVLMKNKNKFGTRTITQAVDLKLKLEKLGLTSTNATIASIDAESMYPSIKYNLIEKAINYYTCMPRASKMTMITSKSVSVWK